MELEGPPPSTDSQTQRQPNGRSVAKRGTSPDAVVTGVKEGILHGRYLPGQRLFEADLRHAFRLSRGPVREAMTRLATEGILAAGPGRGLYVRALTRAEALNLTEVLQALIGLAARLAATRCRYTPNRQRLGTAYERLMSGLARNDSVMMSIERTRFYDTLFEVAGNPELTRAHPSVTAQILRAQVFPFLTPEDRLSQYADYQPLFDAIMAGDSRTATRIVDTHLQRSRSHARDLPDAAFEGPWNQRPVATVVDPRDR